MERNERNEAKWDRRILERNERNGAKWSEMSEMGQTHFAKWDCEMGEMGQTHFGQHVRPAGDRPHFLWFAFDKQRAPAEGARIRELSKGLSLGGLTIRELIDERKSRPV